jgi:molecular chaperone DnaJ
MTGQDWFSKDFYAALGVPKDADQAAIKKAYRKKASAMHPDANPDDPKAEERFKDLGEAYSVLSDPAQREKYDGVRAMAGGGARFAAGPGGPGAGGFEDLFGGVFGQGGARMRFASSGQGAGGINLEDLLGGMSGGYGGGFGPQARPRRGRDVAASVTLSFREAATGSNVTLDAGGRKVTGRVPAGVKDGQRIRLRGKGEAGQGGGQPGDIIMTVKVIAHPVWSLDGNNLRISVPVSFAEATLGARVDVPTLEGGTVAVKVPAGTPAGRVLRVKGRGIETSKGKGDLLVSVQVAVPHRLSKDAKSAVEALRAATADQDPRVGLAEAARS